MKAAVFTEFGPPDVLHIKELEKPTPKNNEILIKIYAASINFGDTLVRNFKAISPRKFNMPFLFWLFGKIYFGFRKPKITILGNEFSGKIEAVGKNVKRFMTGEKVFGYRGPRMGANAEYLSMPADGVVAIKPINMTCEEAACIPYGAIMALNLLGRVNLHPDQKILIIGASGGIGPALLQLAKHHFKAKVTGVCGSSSLDYVKSLGADKVIDYTKENFSVSDEKYDFIFDILGKISFSRCMRALKPNGRCILISFKMLQFFQMLWTSIFGSKKIICAMTAEKTKDLILIKELIEAGKIKSIIDKCFPLEHAAEAHRYYESGKKTGNVVITINNNNDKNI